MPAAAACTRTIDPSRCFSTEVTSEHESNAHAIASSFAECKAENENVRGTPRDGGKPLHVFNGEGTSGVRLTVFENSSTPHLMAKKTGRLDSIEFRDSDAAAPKPAPKAAAKNDRNEDILAITL